MLPREGCAKKKKNNSKCNKKKTHYFIHVSNMPTQPRRRRSTAAPTRRRRAPTGRRRRLVSYQALPIVLAVAGKKAATLGFQEAGKAYQAYRQQGGLSPYQFIQQVAPIQLPPVSALPGTLPQMLSAQTCRRQRVFRI